MRRARPVAGWFACPTRTGRCTEPTDITRAVGLIERAAAVGGGRAGRFQLQAAIAAVHCEAPTWQDTDWLQIVILYDMLLHLDPSPVTRLNRAIASAELFDVEQALVEVDALGERLRLVRTVARDPRRAAAPARPQR